MARGGGVGGLTLAEERVAKAMMARGDKQHDVAAWFGVNQARVAEATEPATVPPEGLPPKGAPGVKGRRLRAMVEKALVKLKAGDTAGGTADLEEGLKRYFAHEA